MEGFLCGAPRQPVIASMAADLFAVPNNLHRPYRSLCRLLCPVGCLDAHVVVLILVDLTVHGGCDHVPSRPPCCPADEVLALHRLILHRCVLRLPEPELGCPVHGCRALLPELALDGRCSFIPDIRHIFCRVLQLCPVLYRCSIFPDRRHAVISLPGKSPYRFLFRLRRLPVLIPVQFSACKIKFRLLHFTPPVPTPQTVSSS